MKKVLMIIPMLLVVTACQGLSKYIPSGFDSAEYNRLAVLKVLSDNPTLNNYCNTDDLNKIKFETQVLQVYSENALNTNIADVYTEIASLASELSDRQDASQAYCRLKRQNITEATDRALAVFGRRKK
jgi:hypothetical protein